MDSGTVDTWIVALSHLESGTVVRLMWHCGQVGSASLLNGGTGKPLILGVKVLQLCAHNNYQIAIIFLGGEKILTKSTSLSTDYCYFC